MSAPRALCESCERRPAVRAVMLAHGVAPFMVCQACDLRALAAEGRATAATLRHDPTATDTPDRIAARRAVLETF